MAGAYVCPSFATADTLMGHESAGKVGGAGLVILDRDGVINEDSEGYIKSPDEFVPIPGSLSAIARLNHAGYRVVVVSNQSGIARGLFSVETLHRIHDKLHRLLASVGGKVDAIVYCPHGPEENCSCRKPAPGMLRDVAARLGVSLAGVPAVGDAARDLEAARAVGAEPVLVRTGKGERTLAALGEAPAVPVYADLASFVDAWLTGPAEE